MPDALSIDVLVESPLWEAEPQAETVVRRALCEAASVLSTKPAELAIVLTDDSAIRVLNRTWRRIDAPTNVLSFPAQASRRKRGRNRVVSALPILLGDIVIAYETTAEEACIESKSFHDHLAHLAVHGFLHLLGYDHDRDSDAENMEEIERSILARLDIPDPYAARDAAPTAGPHA
jgi:probable rRNA maturation factor